MDSVAGSASIDALFSELNCSDYLTWAPIRHHSPVCAHQLERYLADIDPDVVLVEGPSEANALLPHLFAPSTRFPVAFFSYVVEKKRSKSDTPQSRYRAYLPLTDMSPERIGLKFGQTKGKDASFIDLPHEQRLMLLEKPSTFSQGDERLLYDDRLFAHASVMDNLIKQSACRDFNEWWDRHFESGLLGQDFESSPKTFFRKMHLFSLFLRAANQTNEAIYNNPHPYLLETGIDQETRAREYFMAGKIFAEIQKKRKVMVVCGGFHCLGIARILRYLLSISGNTLPENPMQDFKPGSELFAPGTVVSGIHLVPYSLHRFNQASGYAAGFPDCAYYDRLWHSTRSSPDQRTFITELVTRLQNAVLQAGYPVTTSDAIEAVSMAFRLASLRQTTPGRVEMREAVSSAFLKQANDGRSAHFFRVLDETLAGKRIGALGEELPLAPIISDFRQQCQHFKLPLNKRDSVERSLDLYRSKHHQRQSQLLHQLAFLEVAFGVCHAGPDFVEGIGLNRVRETWRIQWTVDTEPKLIECSAYGHSVAEAAYAKLREQIEHPGCRGEEKVKRLMLSLTMGLHDFIDPLIDEIERWMREETSALALGHALQHLVVAFHFRSVLSTHHAERLKVSLQMCFERTCVRLPGIGKVPNSKVEAVCRLLVMMAGMVNSSVQSNQPWGSATLFYRNLRSLIENRGQPQCIGAATGILLLAKRLKIGEVEVIIEYYFAFIRLKPDLSSAFLKGFLRHVRGLLGNEPAIVTLLDKHVMSLSEAQFLAILPGLRLAFSHLSPREVTELVQCLNMRVIGESKAHWHAGGNFSQATLEMAKDMRQQLKTIENQWGWLL